MEVPGDLIEEWKWDWIQLYTYILYWLTSDTNKTSQALKALKHMHVHSTRNNKSELVITVSWLGRKQAHEFASKFQKTTGLTMLKSYPKKLNMLYWEKLGPKIDKREKSYKNLAAETRTREREGSSHQRKRKRRGSSICQSYLSMFLLVHSHWCVIPIDLSHILHLLIWFSNFNEKIEIWVTVEIKDLGITGEAESQ